MTRLEDTFGVNMLAISDGRPETLGLKQIIKANTDFQFEINRRKYERLLAKEQEKREIQEGLIKACNVIDLIIENFARFTRPDDGKGVPGGRRDGGNQI